jgi:4-carboxymuconolactone decarboxylase
MTTSPPNISPRLPLVETPEDPLTQERFAKFAAGNGVLNLHRMMAHAPALMKASSDMAFAFRSDSALPRTLVELVILRTAQVVESKYEWARHLPLAAAHGVTETQIQELAHWPESAAFTDAETAAIGFAEKAALRQLVPDDEFATLRRHFSPRQIVEIAMLVGQYVATAIFIQVLPVPPEPGDPV